MKDVSAIILAAGLGRRFNKNTSKPLVRINGKPLLAYSLMILSGHPRVKELILVVNKKNRADAIRLANRYCLKNKFMVTLGGRRRQDSVFNGLKCVSRESKYILIHDSARPFITKSTTSDLINGAERNGAAITGVALKSTIKEASESRDKRIFVERTLDRDKLWEIQTPQVFNRDLIMAAYSKYGHIDVTDDALLVEKLGNKIEIIPGSYSNIKITTIDDLAIAEAICKFKPKA